MSRRHVGIFLGPLSFVVLLAAPLPLGPEAHRLAAVFGLVVVLWVTEAIPLAATALLGPSLAVVLGVADVRTTFAAFGDPVLFLFLGSFLIAAAMRKHDLDRRIALFVLSRRWIGGRPSRILLAFGGVAWFLSMWMSNTATAAMMLPIGLGVLGTLPESGIGRKRSFATGLLLMIAYACSVGGIATPVGTPPNLIALGMLERITGIRIGFFEWMAFAVPISVAAFGFVYFVLSRLFPAPVAVLEGAEETIRAERGRLGPWSSGERAALAAFLAAVTLWTLPGLLALALGDEHPLAELLQQSFPEGPSALIAAYLLFVLPGGRGDATRALEWRDTVGVDWGTIMLFGGGLALGGLAFSTGLAAALSEWVGSGTAAWPAAALLLAAVLLGDLLTEFMSNTATANVLIPVFLAVAGAAAGGSILPALGAALGCSLAFCLPVATPPNAIMYSGGRVPLPAMIRAGVLLDLGCAILAWAGLLLAGRLVL
jgi:solute carrier family 13 (sodium-dependent dicarboxylate transporter), member 2/3/5